MRETVPTDGLTSGGAGEEMFTSLFDEHLATVLPSQWKHGLGEAVVKQLAPHLPSPPAP
jgi:Rod binding domain-containing protein